MHTEIQIDISFRLELKKNIHLYEMLLISKFRN